MLGLGKLIEIAVAELGFDDGVLERRPRLLSCASYSYRAIAELVKKQSDFEPTSVRSGVRQVASVGFEDADSGTLLCHGKGYGMCLRDIVAAEH